MMAKDVKVSHRNLGTVNRNMVTISTDKGSTNLYFSYDTLVAVDGTVSKNYWSVTTGKLLNQLEPDKKKRVTQAEVQAKARDRLKSIL